MKRLGVLAIGLALVIGAVAVVFAVWASLAQAPWERTASTTSP
jgi:multidrug resistance efflux pump